MISADRMEQIQDLANAVVVQAAVDYGYYTKQLHKANRRSSVEVAQRELNRIEEFFMSDRFKMYTTLNGYEILLKLRDNPFVACNNTTREYMSYKAKGEKSMVREIKCKECICDICGKKVHIALPLALPKDWQQSSIGGVPYDMCESCASKIERTIAQIKRGE